MQIQSMLVATLATLIVALTVPITATAEDEAPPVLIVSHCMKSTSPDYVGVETDIWLPMHQERVNNGQLNGWALYWVQFGDRAKCDYYVIESYLGGDQFNNANPVTSELFETVHPGKDMSKAMAKTAKARVMAESTLWLAVDAVDIGPHQFATVNYMHAEDPKAYVDMERDVYKPVHQALTDSGHRAGWGLYSLIAPNSGSMAHNFATVDFFDRWGPVPMGETFASVHPDMDMDEVTESTIEARQMVGNYTMVRIAATEPRPVE